MSSVRAAIVANLILAILLMNAGFAWAETEVVYNRISKTQTIQCGYAEWPPFMTIDANTQKVSGLMYDVWEIIGKKLDLKIEWSMPLGWGEITEAVKAGKMDVFCVGVWPHAGRMKNLLLSRPVFYNPVYLYARDKDTRFDNNYDLLNDPSYTVSGQDGDSSASVLAMKFPKASIAHIAPMQPQSDMVLNVVTKKSDVTILDVPYADDYSVKNPGKIRRVKGPPIGIFPVSIPLAVGETQLKSMIDAAINDMINDGTIGVLIKKWSAVETYVPQPDVIISTNP